MEVTIRLDREDRQAQVCSIWSEWSWKEEEPWIVTDRLQKARFSRVRLAVARGWKWIFLG
jgi:hypothetical protein